jgi:hypothetical protein
VQTDGLCTATGASGLSAVTLVDAGGAAVPSVTCPAVGASLALTPAAHLNNGTDQCKYTGSPVTFTCERALKVHTP